MTAACRATEVDGSTEMRRRTLLATKSTLLHHLLERTQDDKSGGSKTDQPGIRLIVIKVAKTGQKVWLVPMYAYAAVLSERLLFSLMT
jgi:hypothetical protein